MTGSRKWPATAWRTLLELVLPALDEVGPDVEWTLGGGTGLVDSTNHRIPKSLEAVQAVWMRVGIVVSVTPKDRVRLEAIVADGNTPQKHVKRARAILATADGCGTNEIMRRSGLSKPVVWRWQERFMHEGVDGLLRDKTRKPGKTPLPPVCLTSY